MRSVSLEFWQAATAQETGKLYLYLLTLTHSSLAQPIRVCNTPVEPLPSGGTGIMHDGDEYVWLPFDVALPGETETGISATKIEIDNVSREIVAAVRSIRGWPDAELKVVEASAPEVVEAIITGLELRQITYNVLKVAGNLVFPMLENEPYSQVRFNQSYFPGVH